MSLTVPAAAKWIPGLFPDTPCASAARRSLRRRVEPLIELLPLAAGHADENVEYVHQLRVATRRAAAALRLFGDWCAPGALRSLRRRLRDVRRAAGDARRDDVHAAMLADHRRLARFPRAAALLRESVADSRRRAQAAVVRCAQPRDVGSLRSMHRRLLRSIRREAARVAGGPAVGDRPYTLSELAAQQLPAAQHEVRQVVAGGLDDVSRLHELRLCGKRLRYSLELLAGCLGDDFREQVYPALELSLEQLGDVNDRHELALRARELRPAKALAAEWARLVSALESERDAAQAVFHQSWAAGGQRLLDEIDALLAAHCPPPRATRSQLLTLGRRRSARRLRPAAAGNGHPPAHVRVAALDVGTNSIRMVVAESDAQFGFRVIDDVGETTRLGGGLYQTGRLSQPAIDRSLVALERMRELAAHYHVDRLRAVATSAVREASNAREFLDACEQRAGLSIETINAEYEARLAFSSVLNAFELDDVYFATCDLGGGSADIVFSHGGLIDRLLTLPLGAVRLTDVFGREDRPGAYRFAQMREACEQVIREQLGAIDDPPELMIGTGGTFTTIAKISIRRGTLPLGEGRFPFALRGYEVSADEVAEMLDWLRQLPLDQRRRVPGLGERRAEIIVGGLCVVERLMAHLGVRRLRVHDGGIRDGLLSEMIDGLGLPVARLPEAGQAALSSVRDFAGRSRYPREHSEHVARLALRIFEQLAGQIADATGSWAAPEARDLLQLAAVLHDVGLLLGVPRHHRHSYDMIVHADLPLLSVREVELIANVARYHRRRGPRRRDVNFRRLSEDDQRLVTHLAGILRIADGLDRLHDQAVEDVVVHVRPGCVVFEVCAVDEPSVHIEYARRKSDLFARSFRADVQFDWLPRRRAARPRRRHA